MPANTYSQWQNLPPYGIGAPGAPVQGSGGGPQPFFRSEMDARLSKWNTLGQAQYPASYLGTIRSRRDDRLLGNLKSRQNQRAYQRGVHKGERIDPGDYQWPKEFSPDRGLRMEAEGRRQAPLTSMIPTYSPRQFALQGAEVGIGEGGRSKALRRQAPPWQ